MIRYILIFIASGLMFSGIGLIAGFHLGSDKSWASATAYYTSGYLNLITATYPPGNDTVGELCRRRIEKEVRPAVEKFGRYKRSWTSQIDLGLAWDNSTNHIMAPVVAWYIDNSDINYSSITEEEYWLIVQSLDPNLYEETKNRDPDLYQEFKIDALDSYKNVRAAVISN